MIQDTQTVPVTVTVRMPPHHPTGTPDTSLPFTGAPVEALVVIGVLLCLIGVALVLVRRRRSVGTRSPA